MPSMPPQTNRLLIAALLIAALLIAALLIAALLMATASRARADVMLHDVGNNAAKTLSALGTDFVYGCAVLAIGLVVSVFLYRRK